MLLPPPNGTVLPIHPGADKVAEACWIPSCWNQTRYIGVQQMPMESPFTIDRAEMKQSPRDNTPRAAKSGERTGTSCPLCGEPVLRQEIASNGSQMGTRRVCSKRGCPWQGKDH